MATTAQEVFNITMALIDEVTDSGIISPTETITYKAKTPSLLTLLQTELIKQGDFFGEYEISNSPISNLFGYQSEYDIKEFTGEEFIVEAEGSAKAYYFELDRAGTVYVEDYNGTWNTLETVITTYTPGGYTNYKGVVTPSIDATKSRLRFSGSYYYRTANRALFSVPFAVDADVPDYRPWIKKTMPVGFKSVNEIIIESTDNNYSKDASYKWEGRSNLYINYYFKGNIRIIYIPVPTPIAAMASTLQLDDVTCLTILPYGLAAHLMLEENAATASFFNGRFEELKSEASKPSPAQIEEIENFYGGFE